ncbi:hypothetical protein CY34DRAFT_776189 [Suillus luteus UH-Slu-Lm8-n1]|uniref:Uncharacterized protein n=1 Tax=Suillus luteus UH-Slu-Lm8-n1 TaxID=930992 RepID=A0A0D0AGQ5_9AGAM|nr:hypothetical protein CY34DRAFT_776189 [Suillus luteus UH-Slu-Lm8-n1]
MGQRLWFKHAQFGFRREQSQFKSAKANHLLETFTLRVDALYYYYGPGCVQQYIDLGFKPEAMSCWATLGYVGLHQATLGYVRLRQATSGYIRLRWATSGYIGLHQATLGYVRLRRATSGYVGLRQATLGYVRLCRAMSGYIMLGYIGYVGLRWAMSGYVGLLYKEICYTMSHLTSLTDVYLHDEDHSYALQEPFVSTFGNLLSINTRLLRNTEQTILDKLVEDLKSNTSYVNWHSVVYDWTQVTIGMHLPLHESLSLFVSVLWKKTKGASNLEQSNYEAQKMLKDAKQQALSTLKSLSRVTWQLALDDMASDSENESESESDFSEEEILKTKSKTLNYSNNKALSICQRWKNDFKAYFIASDISHTQLVMAEKQIIGVIQACRKIGPKTYKSMHWLNAVKESGLLDMVAFICKPDTSLELSSDHIATSFRQYQWKNSLGLVFDQWSLELPTSNTPSQALPELHTIVKPMFDKGSNKKAKKFPLGQAFIQALDELDNTHRLIPTASQPLAAGFLNDEESFIQAYHSWLYPSIIARGYSVKHEPKELYSLISSQVLNRDTFVKSKISLKSWRLACVIDEVIEYREHIKRVRKEVFWIQETWKLQQLRTDSKQQDDTDHSRSCITCLNLPDQDKCLQKMEVERQLDAHKVQGSIITCANVDDYPLPKTSRSSKITQPVYYHPNSLGLTEVSANSDIIQRCGRHAIRFIDKQSKNCVGGVIFSAMKPDTLQQMKDNHSSIINHPSVKRGTAFQAYNYGKMIPYGARQPQGGRRGDCYTTYSMLRGDTQEDIKAIFRHIKDAETLLLTISYAAPLVVKNLRDVTSTAKAQRLGSTGCVTFYCHNYVAPQHKDNDVSWTISTQLERRGKDDEWNFSFTEWGVYIRNMDNTTCMRLSEFDKRIIIPMSDVPRGNEVGHVCWIISEVETDEGAQYEAGFEMNGMYEPAKGKGGALDAEFAYCGVVHRPSLAGVEERALKEGGIDY